MSSPTRPLVAWISPSGTSTSTPAWLEGGVHHISSPDQLLEGPAADVIVVDGFTDAGPLIQELRSQPHGDLRLIYLNADGGALAAALADGPVPDAETGLMEAWTLWQERLTLFNRGRPPAQLTERLLCWLWQRPVATITPLRDAEARDMYRYPLVEALAGDRSVNAWSFLQQLRQTNQLPCRVGQPWRAVPGTPTPPHSW